MGVKAALPRYEVYLYTAVLGVAMAWAASWIVEASSGEWMETYGSCRPTGVMVTSLRLLINC